MEMSVCQRTALRLGAFKLTCGKAEGASDDGAAFDDADNACHGYAADADKPCMCAEDFSGAHGADGIGAVGAEQRNDEPPHEHGACEYYECIFESYDVAQAEHRGSGIARHHELGLGGERLAPAVGCCGDGFGPYSESGYDIVVDATYQRGCYQQLGLAAGAALCGVAADEHLSGGGGFRERIFAMHILYKILAEGYEEQNAENAAQQ